MNIIAFFNLEQNNYFLSDVRSIFRFKFLLIEVFYNQHAIEIQDFSGFHQFLIIPFELLIN